MTKNLVSGPILAHYTQRSAVNFLFSKIWLPQPLDVMVNYHHGQNQKKINDPILKKLSDGQTDGRTDRRTEGRTEAGE